MMNETQTSIRIYQWNQHVSTFQGMSVNSYVAIIVYSSLPCTHVCTLSIK